MHQFNEEETTAALLCIRKSAQSAFAHACAVRTEITCSDAVSNEALALCSLVDEHANQFQVYGVIDSKSVEDLNGELDANPELDSDRVAAFAFVSRHLISGEIQDAVWAARRAYEAADRFAQEGLEFDVYSVQVEAQLLSHPAVQSELECQTVDLAELLASPENCAAIVARAKSHVRQKHV